MIIHTKFTPKIMKADSYSEIMERIKRGWLYIENKTLTPRHSDIKALNMELGVSGTVRLYRLQKFNKKSSETQEVVDGRNITTTKILRRPHWIAYVYDVPEEIIDTATQYQRSFSLKIRTI